MAVFIFYLQVFCRIAIGLVFAFSSFRKAFHVASFQRTIQAFALLPRQFVSLVAPFLIVIEGIITVMLAIGNTLLMPGFLLAIFLLVIFSFVLIIVLRRRMQVSCNCFGPSERQVTYGDVYRNSGFILCSLVGLGTGMISGTDQVQTGIFLYGMIGLSALIFVLIWTQLGEIIRVS